MNELRRMAYLDALGIDSYVSRRQLPGAAVSQRLMIVPPLGKTVPVHSGDISATAVFAEIPKRRKTGELSPAIVGTQAEAAMDAPEHSGQRATPVPRFSLTTIVAGDWLWLEELADMPLTTEQVQLVQSMARALGLGGVIGSDGRRSADKPDVLQFDWPIHTNRQLDSGEEAGRAAVAGFVSRRLEQHGCRGLVLLGQSAALRLPVQAINVLCVSTASSAEILANPALKRQVWRDLQPLASKA